MNDLPIALRPAVADDYGYILETWSRNLHKTYPWNLIPNSTFYPHQKKLINSIVAQVVPLVACIEDEPNQLVGYLVAQPYGDSNLIIHYGCVKGIFRRLGVMKTLLEQFQYQDKNLICTHYFPLFKELKDKYHLIFDPTLLENYK